MDETQPETEYKPHPVTAADLAEAAARAGLRDGDWGSLSVDKDGVRVRPLSDTAPPRTEIEKGDIGWVDAYLESDSAFRSPFDPRMLRPAPASVPENRATRRERANKIRTNLRGQRGKKAKRR